MTRKVLQSFEADRFPMAIRLVESNKGYVVELDFNKNDKIGKSTVSTSYKDFNSAATKYYYLVNTYRNT